MQANGIRVAVSKNNFSTGLKYAKQLGGKFDGATKTWILPATETVRNHLRVAGVYGLVIANPVAGHDAGCSAYYMPNGVCECQE